MQTIQFLETAKWIYAQYSRPVMIFLDRIGIMVGRGARGLSPEEIMIVVHDLAVARKVLATHPRAQAVLSAFQLDNLLSPEFIRNLGVMLLKEGEAAGPDWRRLSDRWRIFHACIEPIEKLTVPEVVSKEKDHDEVLTVEIRSETDTLAQIENLRDMLTATEELYRLIANALGIKSPRPLVMVYAASGTSIRLDFKGLGAPIREFKKLFTSTWHLIRNRKADSLQANVRAAFEGLDLISMIDAKVAAGTLSQEEGNSLRTRILGNTHALFDQGVLVREIPDEESVSNTRLLEAMNPRLLTAGSNGNGDKRSDDPPKNGAGAKKKKKPKSTLALPESTTDDGDENEEL